MKAVAFVNEDRLFVPGEVDARIALLTEWLDAGMELGNHTFGHVGLTRTPLPAMQDAVLKGEVVTRGLLQRRGQTLKWFRHPYTHTGTTREIKDAFETFLASRGYTRGKNVGKLFAAEPEAPKWVADLDRARREAPTPSPAGIP